MAGENKTILDDWKPFGGRIYEDKVGVNDFVSAATVALLGTPHSTYKDDAIDTAKVIGLIQDWNVSQTKQAPQLFECGSNGKYTLSTGRVTGSMNISRVMYNGSNLLYLLYAGEGGEPSPLGDQKDLAGFENAEKTLGFAINLASSVFLRPLGLFVVIKAASTIGTDQGIGGFFLQNAYVTNHGIGASAGAPYVGEQVSLTFEALRPISINPDFTDWPATPAAE